MTSSKMNCKIVPNKMILLKKTSMNQLPKDVTLIVYKLIFESYFELFRKEFLFITGELRRFLNRGRYLYPHTSRKGLYYYDFQIMHKLIDTSPFKTYH